MPVVLTPHEQPAVEAGIAGRNRAVAGDAVHIHGAILVHPAAHVSRFSDIIILSTILAKNAAINSEK